MLVFYKRAIAALCRMVLFDEDYTHQGQSKKKVGNSLDRKAEDIALIVAKHCLDISNDDPMETVRALERLLWAGDYRDPGEPFQLGEELHRAVNYFQQNKTM